MATSHTHTVRRGDTLTSIAKLHHCTIDDLANANDMANRNMLAVGQVLLLPRVSYEQLPPAKLNPRDESKLPAKATERSWLESIGDYALQRASIQMSLLEGLLNRFRVAEANENIQHKESFAITKQTQPVAANHEPPRNRHSKSSRKLADVKAKLKEQLGKEPHVATFKGVKLTENEKRQIMAAVATCEMNSDGFGSINSDQEFRGRKFGNKGIETWYSRIVHIGLSYGIIQFTQDGGPLGTVLTEMQKKNPAKFTEIFGGGDAAIAKSLVTLCTTGRPDLANDSNVPLSGQQYWNSQWDVRKKTPKTEEGGRLHKLANKDDNHDNKSDLPTNDEIRGKRVQPIKANANEKPTDIWTGTWKQRFLDAGQVTDFQEVQIAAAVRDYMNPILKRAKENNVRSALALAFITACSVRGGPNSALAKLFYTVGKELGVSFPIKKPSDEEKIILTISGSNGKIGSLQFDADDARRAKELRKDELGFLAEDFYDTSTY